jgi:hypothetical protein
MSRVRTVTGADECHMLWQSLIPEEMISDLWEVRDCFNREYRHSPCFIVAEERGKVSGLLPLSKDEETGSYGCFPGETWGGKTWLEQNRIIARDQNVLRALLSHIPGKYHLRYLRPLVPALAEEGAVDEIGYFFLPPRYGYEMERYYEEFSHKTLKRLKRELAAWDANRVTYRYDDLDDFDLMIRMNLERYGEGSYFFDSRFLNSFRSLMLLLRERGWLRMTTVLIDGTPAAVDMGCTYNGTYTLLAGGTNPEFPGIAKVINLHHMQWACEQRAERVDFLCGDFNWKSRFHLTPQPLYVLTDEQHAHERPAAVTQRPAWAGQGTDSRALPHV